MGVKIHSTLGSISIESQNATGAQTLYIPSISGSKTLLTTDGSAASLTSIPAANITGTLPAISGASLTGVGTLGNAQEWTRQQNFNATTLTFDATQDWDLATNQVCKVTLTANTTFDAPSNQVDGSVYVITIIQDGTGSRTAGWNTVFKWAGATVPTLTTTASAKDILTFVSDGTNMLNIAQVLNVS